MERMVPEGAINPMKSLRILRIALCPLTFCLLTAASAPVYAQDAAKTEESVSHLVGSVPEGPALSASEVIILLQARVPVDTIQQFVAKRGVAFTTSKETGQKIIAAGGNVALVGTISLNLRDDLAQQADNGRKKK